MSASKNNERPTKKGRKLNTAYYKTNVKPVKTILHNYVVKKSRNGNALVLRIRDKKTGKNLPKITIVLHNGGFITCDKNMRFDYSVYQNVGYMNIDYRGYYVAFVKISCKRKRLH